MNEYVYDGQIPYLTTKDTVKTFKRQDDKKVWKNVPESEINIFIKMHEHFNIYRSLMHDIQTILCPKDIPSREFAARTIASYRRSNKKCNHCKKEFSKKRTCSKCRLVFYCNEECQKKHWKKHKEYCCKKYCKIESIPYVITDFRYSIMWAWDFKKEEPMYYPMIKKNDGSVKLLTKNDLLNNT